MFLLRHRSLFRCSIENIPKQSQKLKMNKSKEEILMNAIVAGIKNKETKPKEEYRAAILFEEILNREIDINLYNTYGRPHLVKTLLYISGALLCFYGLHETMNKERWYKKTFDVFKVGVTVSFLFVLMKKYRDLYRYTVESVSYNTKNKLLTITKRNIIGLKRAQTIERDKLLFTSDQLLNQLRINYLNIDSLECYAIGYEYAWKNKDLFSHLLMQNVR